MKEAQKTQGCRRKRKSPTRKKGDSTERINNKINSTGGVAFKEKRKDIKMLFNYRREKTARISQKR